MFHCSSLDSRNSRTGSVDKRMASASQSQLVMSLVVDDEYSWHDRNAGRFSSCVTRESDSFSFRRHVILAPAARMKTWNNHFRTSP